MWTKANMPEFRKQLSDEQRELWIDTANRVESDCSARNGSKCDEKAVQVANAAVRESEVNELVADGYLLKEALDMVDYILWGSLKFWRQDGV